MNEQPAVEHERAKFRRSSIRSRARPFFGLFPTSAKKKWRKSRNRTFRETPASRLRAASAARARRRGLARPSQKYLLCLFFRCLVFFLHLARARANRRKNSTLKKKKTNRGGFERKKTNRTCPLSTVAICISLSTLDELSRLQPDLDTL